MRILIVKHGALGDVVRTSYFAGALRRKFGEKLELFWLTAPAAESLLADNPYIDRLTTTFTDLENVEFDVLYSLDDEASVVTEVAKLKAKKFSGAVLESGQLTYTSDASQWFDMGLLSRFGKARADEMKILNTCGHAEIFQKIFEVDNVHPDFFLSQEGKFAAERFLDGHGPLVGINPYAGGRWPSKEIRDEELYSLLHSIGEGRVFPYPVTVVLFGAGNDRIRNLTLAKRMETSSVKQVIAVADTDASLMILAGYISRLKLMISSDSLAMHLAIAQGIPTLAFFAPTSASEIDSFGICEKLLSTASDYCSYAKNCDNSSITADRLINKISALSINSYSLETVRN
jgi:heptosyltransferase-2